MLVLGNDDSARAAIDPLNRLIFQRASELLLQQGNSRTRRTWVFLDEVKEAGKLEGLPRLLSKGRSKGTCVALGFQSMLGMEAVWGSETAYEILGQCNNQAWLKVADEKSAKVASGTLGQYEQVELVRGQSGCLTRDTSLSVNETWRTADAVMPSEVMGLSPTSLQNGLTGYYITTSSGAWKTTLSFDELIAPSMLRGSDRADIVQFAEELQQLEPLRDEEAHRLGISLEPDGEPERTNGHRVTPDLGSLRIDALTEMGVKW